MGKRKPNREIDPGSPVRWNITKTQAGKGFCVSNPVCEETQMEVDPWALSNGPY